MKKEQAQQLASRTMIAQGCLKAIQRTRRYTYLYSGLSLLHQNIVRNDDLLHLQKRLMIHQCHTQSQ